MTKHEIKRAMFNNLKEQLQAEKSLRACKRYGTDTGNYEEILRGYDKQFNELIKQYGEVK